MEPTEWEDRWTGIRLTKQLVTARRHLRKLHQTQTESTVHTEGTENGRTLLLAQLAWPRHIFYCRLRP